MNSALEKAVPLLARGDDKRGLDVRLLDHLLAHLVANLLAHLIECRFSVVTPDEFHYLTCALNYY